MRPLAALLTAALLIAAPLAEAGQRVTVFAAASLQGALDQFAAEHRQEIVLSYGGSGTMARQVAAGAPADLVILANTAWMDWLAAQSLPDLGPAQVIARNQLVLISSQDALPLEHPGDLPIRLGDGRLAMGHRDAVPAGVYARQWLQSQDLWADLSAQLAETDNVRAALALVARGQVDFALVYATDARADRRVSTVWTIHPDHHDPILYHAAALSPQGAALLAQLAGPAGRQALADHGFLGAAE